MESVPENNEKAIIIRPLEGMPVGQRATDGYINATAMCQAAGKEWKNYHQNQTTKDFLAELSGSVGIPADLLTHTITRGPNEQRGTWVHPLVAVNLAQWCSAAFAVQVSRWVVEWVTTGTNPLQKIPVTKLYDNERLQKAISSSYHHYLSRVNGSYSHVNADLCKFHSDWHWYPHQYMEWAVRQGWPSKDRTSGVAVLRRKEKPSAGAITFEKLAIMSGVAQGPAREMASDFKALATKMLAHGMSCAELEMSQEEGAA